MILLIILACLLVVGIALLVISNKKDSNTILAIGVSISVMSLGALVILGFVSGMKHLPYYPEEVQKQYNESVLELNDRYDMITSLDNSFKKYRNAEKYNKDASEFQENIRFNKGIVQNPWINTLENEIWLTFDENAVVLIDLNTCWTE